MTPICREAEGCGVGSEGTFCSLPPSIALVMVQKEQNPKCLLQQTRCEPRRLLQSWDVALGALGGSWATADGVALVQSVKQDWHIAKRQAGYPNLGSPQAQL